MYARRAAGAHPGNGADFARRADLFGGDKIRVVHTHGCGAAQAFVEDFVPLPVLRVEYVAYGTGKKNFETANVVRVLLGETEGECEQIIELACNLDDTTPEELGFAMEELFRLGALDVYFTSIGMKKSRSGVMLTCMCRVQQRDEMLRCLFKHTTTLGVREYVCNRYSLTRSIDTVQTEYGAVRIKKPKAMA